MLTMLTYKKITSTGYLVDRETRNELNGAHEFMLSRVAFDYKASYFHLFYKVCECVDEDTTRHEDNEPIDKDASNTSNDNLVINCKGGHERQWILPVLNMSLQFFIRNKKLKSSI